MTPEHLAYLEKCAREGSKDWRDGVTRTMVVSLIDEYRKLQRESEGRNE